VENAVRLIEADFNRSVWPRWEKPRGRVHPLQETRHHRRFEARDLWFWTT